MIRLTILLLSLSFWSNGQHDLFPQAPNLTTANLKGSVRSIEETSFVGKSENGDSARDSVELFEEQTRETKYVYDSLGHLLRSDFCRGEIIISSQAYVYTNGKLTESLLDTEHRIFEYDDQGRMVREYLRKRLEAELPSGDETPFDTSNSLKIEYFYDSSGNIIAKKGMLESTDSIFYDKQNRPIKILSYFDDYIEFEVMKYDADGNLLRLSKGLDSKRFTDKVHYTYENNQLIKEERKKIFMNNRLDERTVHYYENGNEMKIFEAGLNGREEVTTDFVYEFDDMGNWIKKTAIASDSNLIWINTRKIEYYQ